jgi:hypothetical protein
MLAEQQMENRNTDQDIHLQRTEQCLTRFLFLVCVRTTESNVYVIFFII